MLEAGQMVAGRFWLAGKVGAGGFGTVWLAEDRKIPGRRVAVKEVEVSSDQERRLFRGEIEVMGSIQHPNIVILHDVLDRPDDELLMIMEYMSRGTLARKLAEDGPLAVEQAVDLILGAIEGLAALHNRDIVHKDVKPSNLFLDDNVGLKLGDLGLAHPSGEQEYGGTLPFMAPELLSRRAYDERVDIYALGVTLYQMTVGDLPFTAVEKHELVYKILNERPPIPDSLPRWFASTLQKALAKPPELRFRRAEEVGEYLKSRRVPELLTGEVIIGGLLNDEAEQLIQRKRLNKARAKVEHVLERNPTDGRARLIKGIIQFYQGDLSEAEQTLAEARRYSVDSSRVDKYLGLVAYEQCRFDRAVSALSYYLHGRTEDLEAYNALACAYFRLGEIEEAARVYDTLLEWYRKSRVAKVYANSAVVRYTMGDLSGALELWGCAERSRDLNDVVRLTIRYNWSIVKLDEECESAGGGSVGGPDRFFLLPLSPPRRRRAAETTRISWKDRATGIVTGVSSKCFLSVGSLAGCDIPIADPRTSRRHAVLFCEDRNWWVQDLRSTYGTWVDGTRVVGRTGLGMGATVMFGRVELQLSCSA